MELWAFPLDGFVVVLMWVQSPMEYLVVEFLVDSLEVRIRLSMVLLLHKQFPLQYPPPQEIIDNFSIGSDCTPENSDPKLWLIAQL